MSGYIYSTERSEDIIPVDDKSHIAAKNDTTNLTILQQKLYEIDESEVAERGEDIVSPYYYPNKILSYSSVTEHVLQFHGFYKEQHMYTVDTQLHKLRNVYATFKFPDIAVDEKMKDCVEIALCPNFMHNLLANATLTIQGEHGSSKNKFTQTVNTFVMDSIRARDLDDTNSYDYAIGNRPDLLEWNNELVAVDEFVLPIPFFMDASPKLAIPCHLYNKKESILITCKFNLNIENFIRMHVKDETGKWHLVKPDLDLLDISGNNVKFNPPTLWGRYSTLTDGEINEEKSTGYKIYITDYEYIPDTRIMDTTSIQIAAPGLALRGYRFGFLNAKALEYNNHSNYSLNHSYGDIGDDPLDTYSLSDGKFIRIPKRSNVHSSLVPALYCLGKGNPQKRLFHDLVWDHYPYNIYVDTSIQLQQNSLTVSLRPREFSTEGSIQTVIKTKKYKPLKTLSKDQIINELLIRNKDIVEWLRDGSPSKLFIMKGYARVIRMITYSVGMIVVDE